jgi:hypothetical protein
MSKKTKKTKKTPLPTPQMVRSDEMQIWTSTAKQRTTLTATVLLRRPLEPEGDIRVEYARN